MNRRRSLVLTSLFTFSLVALALWERPPAQAAERGQDHRSTARFSSDLVALHEQGWTLARIETPASEHKLRVSLTLVDAKRTQGQRATLFFQDLDQAPVDYILEDALVPDEERVYNAEASLFEVLARGPVIGLTSACNALVLTTNEDEAVVDENDFHVLRRRISGKAAGEALANELRTNLSAGAHVVDVSERDDGIAFILAGSGEGLEVLARVDAHGRVHTLEVRTSPYYAGSAVYPSETRLARALEKQKAVSSVTFAEDDSGMHVRLRFSKHKSYVIDLAEMQYPDEGCGC